MIRRGLNQQHHCSVCAGLCEQRERLWWSRTVSLMASLLCPASADGRVQNGRCLTRSCRACVLCTPALPHHPHNRQHARSSCRVVGDYRVWSSRVVGCQNCSVSPDGKSTQATKIRITGIIRSLVGTREQRHRYLVGHFRGHAGPAEVGERAEETPSRSPSSRLTPTLNWQRN